MPAYIDNTDYKAETLFLNKQNILMQNTFYATFTDYFITYNTEKHYI